MKSTLKDLKEVVTMTILCGKMKLDDVEKQDNRIQTDRVMLISKYIKTLTKLLKFLSSTNLNIHFANYKN